MDLFESILVAFGGVAALLAAAIWLTKTLIGQFLARDTARFTTDLKVTADKQTDAFRSSLQLEASQQIERLKASLSVEAAHQTERLRAALNLQAMERQVRYSRLHDKRAEVIAELYELMVEALWLSEDFLSPISWNGEPSKREKYATAHNRLVDFFQHLERHWIYLPHDLAEKSKSLLTEVRSHLIHVGVFLHWSDEQLQEHTLKQKVEATHKAMDALRTNVAPLRRGLEDEFRELLGDDVTKPAMPPSPAPALPSPSSEPPAPPSAGSPA